MTKAQTIQLRLSECRQRLNELLQVETRSDEENTELEKLTSEVATREPELRAAIAAEPDPEVRETDTGENRERLELRAKTGLADYLRAAAGGTSVSGAAAEYAESVGVPATGHLPMALFEPTNQHSHLPTVETRAITPGPAVKGALQPIVPYLFERSAAASLGIMMPSVPSGQVQIPKVGTAPPADTLAKDGTGSGGRRRRSRW